MKKSLLFLVVFLVVFWVGIADAFDPAAHLAQKRAALGKSLVATDTWLKGAGENVQKEWLTFLEYGRLVGEMQKETPNLGVLKDILNLWRKNSVGLEHPNFVSSQRALRDFIRAAEIQSFGDFKTTSARWQSDLKARLEGPKDGDNAAEIGRLLGWLEITGEAPELVKTVRAKWANPNVQVQVSSDLIALSLDNTTVKNDQYASAVIVGIHTGGQAHTEGVVTAVPVESGKKGVGAIELRLNATVNAPNNYGQKGPVGIHSKAFSTAVVTKRILFTGDGIKAEPARGYACTNSQVTQIDAGPIIGWLASRQAAKKKGQANCEAAHVVATKLATEFDAQVTSQLKKAQEDQAKKIKRILEFEGTYPSYMSFASGSGGIRLSAIEANSFQLASPVTPPTPTAGMDLSAVVHETFAGNFLESYLGNKIEHDTSWFNIHKLLTMEEPAPLRVHDNAPKWHLRVTEWSPMVTRFADGAIHFRIRGKEIGWQKGQEQLKVARPVEVHVAYKPVIEEGQVLGERVGEVEVEYTDGGVETDTATKLKNVLHTKMDAFFPERLELGGLSIPKGSGWEKFDKLKPQKITIEDGFLISDYKIVR